MKKFTLIVAMLLISTACWGGNVQITDTPYYIGASVDTDPGVNGYGTVEVKPVSKNAYGHVVFTVTGGTATVDLQFRIADGTWQTEDQYTAGTYKHIGDDSEANRIRAIVLDDNQGSGTTQFGFSWAAEKTRQPAY